MPSHAPRFVSSPLALLCAIMLAAFLPAASPPGTVILAAPAPLQAAPLAPAPQQSDAAVRITNWLILGPMPTPFPAFHAESEKAFDASRLLDYREARTDTFLPAEGSHVHTANGALAAWRVVTADTNGIAIPGNLPTPTITYLATYIETDRWMEIELDFRASHSFEATVDGGSIAKSTAAPAGKKSGSAKLERGKHLLLVKTVCVPGDSVPSWLLDASLKPKQAGAAPPRLSLSPERNLSLADVLDTPRISALAVAPDGSLAALTVSRTVPPEGTRETWIEVRDATNGRLTRTIRDVADIGAVQWAPHGHRLSYTAPRDGKGTIRVLDLDGGATETIVEGIDELGYYRWGPDGSFIIYSVTEKPPKDESGAKRLRGIEDRTPSGRNISSLYLATVPAGLTRRLTAGKHSVRLHDIHPDGRSALISRSYEDLTERPYSREELYRLSLEDLGVELLHRSAWFSGAIWSPAGDRILITGGPSLFGELGRNVPEGTIPNDYDGQAYLFDPKTMKADPITKNFDPAVQGAFWSRADGAVCLVATEKSFVRLFRYDPAKRSFRRLDLPCDVIDDAAIALDKPTAVVTGSSADRPQRLYTVDLKRWKGREILDPGAERFANVKVGRVENWDFTTSDGTAIEGRIHYPPDFDPGKRYPLIVHYYGGTSPIERSFGGRYPNNLWAAMGYVVYVLQPSGAIGYGQQFSSFHVNEWGRIVSGEIIEGTERFLDEHPFADPRRVGCIGASFGGFMTQLLVTRTDIFAAAVSHAGISSISSYWGEGYWGYAYNAVAAANSFPWNRPDIYIEQSPLYHADRVRTPLLLLHGESDTNVPPGESEQMYTALKLLGRTVEYIRFAGQNHFILDYKKRNIWSDAILAWFDRWLKDEPEWWNDMYPPLEGAGTGTGAEQEEAAVEPGSVKARRVELEGGRVVMIGEITREEIVANLHTWDVEFYEYVPDAELLLELAGRIEDVDFTVVLGTWCSDSQREVPRLWRILDDLGYPLSEVEMYAVGSSRFTVEMGMPADLQRWSDDLKKRFGVERVETIIVSKGGVELGRIVEAPEESLERELLRMLTAPPSGK